MANSTPYFPQLRAQCAPLGTQLRRAGTATESLAGLAALFTGYFAGLLVPAKNGAGSRQRELPRVAVFWAFLGQVLLRGASCRWALARLQADAVAKGRQPIKGALDALLAWSDRALRTRRHRALARRTLLARVAADQVPLRPGRSEPRARKRRPKNYQLLNRPRRRMRVSGSRRLR